MRVETRAGGFPTGLLLAAVGAAAAAAIAAFHLDRLPIVLCAFRAATGLPCATCGSTRAFGRLAQLDVGGALTLNPFITLVALAIAVWGVADLLLALRGRTLALRTSAGEAKAIALAVVAALAVNWVYVLAAAR
ncbi:MAG: DUF2752 domain-containing protein [Acidobacteria bacterium]|nr:DUF2752 domain-containing protein [Acidobacteriota bacterium]